MSVCVLNGSVECMNVIKNRKETECIAEDNFIKFLQK